MLRSAMSGALLGLASAMGVAHCVADHARERIAADAGRLVLPVDGGDVCDRACANLLAKGCTVRATCAATCRRAETSPGMRFGAECIAGASSPEAMRGCGNVPVCQEGR